MSVRYLEFMPRGVTGKASSSAVALWMGKGSAAYVKQSMKVSRNSIRD